jgi:hypothetical protein
VGQICGALSGPDSLGAAAVEANKSRIRQLVLDVGKQKAKVRARTHITVHTAHAHTAHAHITVHTAHAHATAMRIMHTTRHTAWH